MAEGETFRATLIGESNQGTAFVFDFGYVDLGSGGGHIDCGIGAGVFQALVQDVMAECLPEAFAFRKYRFACLAGAHAGEVGYVTVDPIVHGNEIGDVLPAEIAISLKRNTGHTSRRDRGRIFFGPVLRGIRTDDNNTDLVDRNNNALKAVRDLLKENITVEGRVLRPVVLSAAGTYSGRTIVNVDIGDVFVHRKSRRFRALG